jgi:hypothetical protein
LTVPLGCAEGSRQGVGANLISHRAGPRDDPAGLGELGLPGDIKAHDVDALVVGRQPSHQLLALLIGLRRQLEVVDLVRAA